MNSTKIAGLTLGEADERNWTTVASDTPANDQTLTIEMLEKAIASLCLTPPVRYFFHVSAHHPRLNPVMLSCRCGGHKLLLLHTEQRKMLQQATREQAISPGVLGLFDGIREVDGGFLIAWLNAWLAKRCDFVRP